MVSPSNFAALILWQIVLTCVNSSCVLIRMQSWIVSKGTWQPCRYFINLGPCSVSSQRISENDSTDRSGPLLQLCMKTAKNTKHIKGSCDGSLHLRCSTSGMSNLGTRAEADMTD